MNNRHNQLQSMSAKFSFHCVKFKEEIGTTFSKDFFRALRTGSNKQSPRNFLKR